MKGKLSGKVAIVTGASKGIGQGLAIGLAAAGASVAVNYKTDAAGAEAACRRIREAGGTGDAFQADIGSKIEFERLIEAVCARYGRIDVLVNNATRTRFGPVFELTEDDVDDVIDTNLRGPFFGIVAAARQMTAQGGGSIINISSCAARLMIAHHSSYTMAKGGLEALTQQLALELAPQRIRLNAISPAPTSTDRNRGYDPDYDRKWGAVIPAGRVARVEDYVGPCVFLASDDSAFLTGQILNVDGGWTLQGRTPDLSSFDYSADRARDKNPTT
ncbi:MAG TPA: SDR family oxidoreductase [Planctomycetaceae bacterium]|nr:SDR family oxidoreductase [Planctomycetaceae bacterium]